MLKIKEFRNKNNLTQIELANMLQVTNKAISTYEKNLAIPKLDTLIKMTQIFNCSLDDLVGLNSSTNINDNKLIYKYNQLNNNNKNLILDIIDIFINNQKS